MSFAERYLNLRILLEIFPATVFFTVNYGWGLMPATAAVLAATVVAVGTGLAVKRRVPVFAIVTLILTLLLSGASLAFDDETFIKMKPTVGKCLFSVALGIGFLFKPSFLARALDGQVQLTRPGWRVLTLCWIGFTLGLATLNEIVWRTMGTDTWVTFTTVLTPVSIIGYISITRLIALRYWQENPTREYWTE
ncbi:MAG: septation protein IspZ [Sneathiella sp.]